MAGNMKGVSAVVAACLKIATTKGQAIPEDQQDSEFEANREIIEDPDKIFIGQKIRIPNT